MLVIGEYLMENKNIYELWISHSMAAVHVVVAVISALLYAVSKVGDYPKFYTASILLFTVGVLHFILHTNLNRQYHFLYDNRNIKSLPKKKIGQINGKSIAKYLVCSAGIIALTIETESGHIFYKIKDLFLTAFAKLIGIFLENGEIDTGDVELQYRFGFIRNLDGNGTLEKGTWEQILSVIQGVLVIIGIVFIVVIIGTVLRRCLKQLVQSVNLISGKNAVRESNDVTENAWKMKSQPLSRWSKDLNIRARWRYKKEINKLRRELQEIPKHMTPSEIEQLVGTPDSEFYMKIHGYYEKARYSEQGCSKEDYECMKRLQSTR